LFYSYKVVTIRHKIEKSSAYSRGEIGLGICWEMSFIATRKSITEIVEPCGTPFSWINVSDKLLADLTWKVSSEFE